MTVAAILAKKLGMTQRFLDDGRVERVTVLEAGPCHVTGIRTEERDGYDAVQLGFGAVKEKRLTKGELGHLKKAGAPPVRTLAEFRDEAGELQVGDEVRVDVFEPGQMVKISGVSKGKGFQGTIKRHNFSRGPASHGSHNVRAPGSIGASATPSRVFKGIKGPGRMGGKRVTQRGLEVVEVIADRNLLLVRGAVPGPKNGTVEVRTVWLRPRGCTSRAASTSTRRSSARPGTRRSCTSACALSWAPAAGAPPPPSRAGRCAAAARSPGARRAPAGPAPARSARRSGRAAAPCSAPPRATTPSRSTARRAVPRCAARCRCTPLAARSPWSTRRGSTRRRPVRPPRRWPSGAASSPCWWRWARTRWRPSSRSATSTASRSSAADALGIADVVGAASLVVSESALATLTALGKGEKAEPAEAEAEEVSA